MAKLYLKKETLDITNEQAKRLKADRDAGLLPERIELNLGDRVREITKGELLKASFEIPSEGKGGRDYTEEELLAFREEFREWCKKHPQRAKDARNWAFEAWLEDLGIIYRKGASWADYGVRDTIMYSVYSRKRTEWKAWKTRNMDENDKARNEARKQAIKAKLGFNY